MADRSFFIRPLEPADARDVWALSIRPEVARWLGGTPFEGFDPGAHGLECADLEWTHTLGAVAGGRVVGIVQLKIGPRVRIRHRANLWMAVHPDHHRRGIGDALLRAMLDAADRWLDVVRIELFTHADNVAAIALYEKHGFVVETRRARDMVRDGRPVDGIGMARIRPGWSQPPDALRPPAAWAERGRPPPGEVVIRPPTLDDAAGLAALFREESVLWGTMQVPTAPNERWRRRLATPERPSYWSLVAEVGGRVAGSAGLSPPVMPRRRHVSSLGMGVHPDFQGMGIGERLLVAALDLADAWLALERVELEVYTDNTRARRLYEKHGFVAEGICRSVVYRDGGYCDSVSMARLRPPPG